jgi:hypothetical protein
MSTQTVTNMRDHFTTLLAAGAATVFAWMPIIEQIHKSVLLPLATIIGTSWIIYQFVQKLKGK